jgi:cell division protein FtsX
MDPNQEENTQNPPEAAPVEATTPPAEPQVEAVPTEHPVPGEDHASKNLIIIAVLAVIVIVLALLYVWGATSNTSNQLVEEVRDAPAEGATLEAETPTIPEVDPAIEALQEVSATDDVATIEEDLDTTELEELDVELDQMMMELDQELDAMAQ